jgi:hypothetical protein
VNERGNLKNHLPSTLDQQILLSATDGCDVHLEYDQAWAVVVVLSAVMAVAQCVRSIDLILSCWCCLDFVSIESR